MTAAIDHVLDLSHDDWVGLERVVARFERDWRRGPRPAIDDYLPDSPALRSALLIELVHADLEFRLTRGEEARVEEYLSRYPDPDRGRDAILGWVKAEYRLRKSRQPDLPLFEFLVRFPDLLADLLELPQEAPPDREPGGTPSIVVGRPPGFDLHGSPVSSPGGGSNGEDRRRIGKFEVESVLGWGSCGVVYRAKDTELDRVVALKVPRPWSIGSTEEADRFLREARSAAGLSHPNIVSVYESGRADSTCFLASELIPGQTLAGRIAEGRLDREEAAELAAIVAEALDHAHRRGVVHRDVKPANILLDDRGRPHVTDFGLARRDSAEATITVDGQILGTPAYMSPEQARGEARGVDGRSDVYSLGVVLYQLLTGVLPFRDDARSMLRSVRDDEPPTPRDVDPTIPRDLETICLRAMAKHPDRRYPTAAAMAEDLRSYLAGRPIRSRPVPAWRKALARFGRRRRAATLIGLLLLAVGIGSAVASRDRGGSGRDRLAYLSIIAAAARGLEAGDTDRVEGLLDRCPTGWRDPEWHYLKRLCRPEEEGMVVADRTSTDDRGPRTMITADRRPPTERTPPTGRAAFAAPLR